MSEQLRKFAHSVSVHIPRYSSADAGLMVKTARDDFEQRRTITELVLDIDKIIQQPYPYKLLKEYAKQHPYLRVVHGAFITQVVKNRWSTKARFAKKCTRCGREYQKPVDHCEDCEPDYPQAVEDMQEAEQKKLQAEADQKNADRLKQLQATQTPQTSAAAATSQQQQHSQQPGTAEKSAVMGPLKKPSDDDVPVGYQGPALLRDPNPQEKQIADDFWQNPNRDDEAIDIFKSLLRDNLSCDDWYLSIETADVNIAGSKGKVMAIYNEAAEEMFICGDRHGSLGNDEWFCRPCSRKTNSWSVFYKIEEHKTCPVCGGQLTQTAYVHRTDASSTVSGRFGKDEMVHGNSDPWLPKRYGSSKAMAVLLELRSATALGKLSFQTYSKGRVSQTIFLKGESQEVANKIAKQSEEQIQKLDFDQLTGTVSREYQGKLWIGCAQGGDIHDNVPPGRDMQALDWAEFWFVKVIGGIYGVQPVMINAPARGPGGYFQKMQLVVQNDVIREAQTMIEDPINGVIYPMLGIQDWKFEFNEIEPRDDMMQAQIQTAKIQAGQAAVDAGLNAKLTDDEEVLISGTFSKSQQPAGWGGQQKSAPLPKQVMTTADTGSFTDLNKTVTNHTAATRRDMLKPVLVKQGDRVYSILDVTNDPGLVRAHVHNVDEEAKP